MPIEEYIKGIEAERLKADLVLGRDDGKECTFGSGYLRHQVVFSSLTCVPTGADGVCTTYSLVCHNGHEDYRKRKEPDVEKQKEAIFEHVKSALANCYHLNFTTRDVSSLWLLCKQATNKNLPPEIEEIENC